ncbi:recombinase family protein [Devosia sp. ZB163]|uniref:recombinase family protein n=1 Tax=Devosia sp. ZB163 TaxID=3025938 RepID=UPI00235EB1C1|nr:recombinase family protein [Devosia sp. ZB163]MDC9823273.1 recombinase family protein [Devosia sp. ZB163]
MAKTTEEVAGEHSATALRACGYFRVSTGRQAEGDLSIPDQRKQVTSFCEARTWTLVTEYVEPGASATDDQRPEFQRMIERATDDDRPFDVIVVHSYSRFFRDSFGLEMYIRKLAKADVRLISVTQELGDDPAQVMMRQVIALFDEYQSRENAKHVLRAMKENALQGYYNGSPLPLGYRAVEVERKGARIKKRVEIDPVEQQLVELIFKLYRHGDGETGPLGTKGLAKWLNSGGHRTRSGARFGVGTVHGILTNRVYIGEMAFNRRSTKTGKAKPASEHIIVEVPPIIDRVEFERVQQTLVARNPKNTAPRVVTGPILLTGLATCGTCGSAMTLRTGTSKTGRVYKYYTCSGAARVGDSMCKGRSIAMDKLDTMVVDRLSDRLFTPDRLSEIVSSLAQRRAEKDAEIGRRIAALEAEAIEAEDKLKRLYRMVEDGVAELDDILRDRIAALRSDRERAQAALDRIRPQIAKDAVSPAMLEKFCLGMRKNIATGEIGFRRTYLRSVIDRVEINDEVIRIIGDKATLEDVIAGKSGVRSFARKWRARRDSNS